MKRKTIKQSTLCWNCKKASGLCSWSKDFTPVEGWKAEPTKIWIGNGSQNPYDDSYLVHECPEFEPLDPLKMLKVEDAEKIGRIVDETMLNSILRKKYKRERKKK